MADPAPDDAGQTQAARIEASILGLVQERGPAKSICPSDVARALAPDWRPLLSTVRQVAKRLAAEGRIEILRKGEAVSPEAARGVIRLRLAATKDAP